MMLDLRAANDLCRVMGDPTRVRMLALLAHEELTVAELTQVMGLAQSRVSTHLSRLKEASLVQGRRHATATFYFADVDAMPQSARAFWGALRERIDDPLLKTDRERAAVLVSSRDGDDSWSASVAGRMERYYSPGRTWESNARGLLGLTQLGEVLDVASGDGALAELIAPHAKKVVCVDISNKVVNAGKKRLKGYKHVSFLQGDMHRLPFDDRSFDQVLLMNALTYAQDAKKVILEAARVLRPRGLIVGATLLVHEHETAVAPYQHVQLGFQPRTIRKYLEASDMAVSLCEVTHEERRAPHFKIVTFHAQSKKEA